MMAEPLRIAALGAGRLGILHAQNLARRVPGAELALIVDSDPATARAAGMLCGVPYHTDPLVALRDPEIQAVEICTASDSHAPLIIAAAAAGKAIFCEKP